MNVAMTLEDFKEGSHKSRNWVLIHASFLQEHVLSIYPWLAAHGREFPEPIARPKGVRKGKLGWCFSNAARHVLRKNWRDTEGQFIYCEGFAIPKDLFPMEHAWLMDKEGNTIDPTWDDGTSYFGVPFKTEFVAREVVRTEHYGVLYNRPNLLLMKSPETCIYTPKEIVAPAQQKS